MVTVEMAMAAHVPLVSNLGSTTKGAYLLTITSLGHAAIGASLLARSKTRTLFEHMPPPSDTTRLCLGRIVEVLLGRLACGLKTL